MLGPRQSGLGLALPAERCWYSVPPEQLTQTRSSHQPRKPTLPPTLPDLPSQLARLTRTPTRIRSLTRPAGPDSDRKVLTYFRPSTLLVPEFARLCASATHVAVSLLLETAWGVLPLCALDITPELVAASLPTPVAKSLTTLANSSARVANQHRASRAKWSDVSTSRSSHHRHSIQVCSTHPSVTPHNTAMVKQSINPGARVAFYCTTQPAALHHSLSTLRSDFLTSPWT